MGNNKSGVGATIGTWLKRLVLVVVVCAIAFGIYTALQPQPTIVNVDEVVRGPMTITVDDDGYTRVKDRYVVSAPLAGDLMRIALEVGDRVEAGDVVGRILPLPSPLLNPQSRAQAEARVAAAEAAHRQARVAESAAGAAVEFAEQELARQEALAARDATPGRAVDVARHTLRTATEELSSARFGARVARHQVEVAQAALSRLSGEGAGDDEIELRAPVGGVVLAVLQPDAGVVQGGTPLLELGDPSALEVVVDVLTTDAVNIEAGASAVLSRWGGDVDLDARVTRVEPKAFTRFSSLGVEEQRVNVLLDIESPREVWAALGDGFRVEAAIAVWSVDDATLVPAGAVFRDGGGWSAYVVRDDSEAQHAALTPLTLGRQDGTYAEVIEGVSAGDRVVLHPGEGLTDGALVAPRRP